MEISIMEQVVKYLCEQSQRPHDVPDVLAMKLGALADSTPGPAITDLRGITETQCSSGNWDYDPYMHGMANGMILALATLEGKDPVFKDAPDVWLADKPDAGAGLAEEN